MNKFTAGDEVMCINTTQNLNKEMVYVITSAYFESGDEMVDIRPKGTCKDSTFWFASRFVLRSEVVELGDIVYVGDNQNILDQKHRRRFVADLGDKFIYRYLTVGESKDPLVDEPTIFRMMNTLVPVVEFTMDEIAEKLGVSVEQLKIKK